MDYYKKYLKYKSKYNLAKENMRGGVVDVLAYYKKTVGLVKFVLYKEKSFVVSTDIQSYCAKIISKHAEQIEAFNTALALLGTPGNGVMKYILIVQDWIDTDNIDLVFALALESTSPILVKPYLLDNRVTIYPMCLRFICRLVLNKYKKEDLYHLLKSLNEKAIVYLQEYKIDIVRIVPDDNPIFTPRCLLDEHLSFPVPPSRVGDNTKNTLVAWFGIMNPNEMNGLMKTKQIIKEFIATLDYKIILTELPGLSAPTETGIIRTRYNGNGPNSTLTISSIAQFLST